MARKKNSIDTEVLKKIYRTVSRIRHFEEQGIKLYRQGLIKGYFHPYLGQEGIAAGVCAGLQAGDNIASTHRGHGHCIAHGANVKGMVAELLGRRDGYCKGYGGSMHIADIQNGNLGANGIAQHCILDCTGISTRSYTAIYDGMCTSTSIYLWK